MYPAALHQCLAGWWAALLLAVAVVVTHCLHVAHGRVCWLWWLAHALYAGLCASVSIATATPSHPFYHFYSRLADTVVGK